MKDHGILLSTDGPEHNVIKMKPPLVFPTATRTAPSQPSTASCRKTS